MDKTRLKTRLVGNLELSDPFMIASSHWTSEEIAFRQLAAVEPSAVTLKTVSAKTGGRGEMDYGKRDKIALVHPRDGHFGYYADGPKALEFWDIINAIRYTQIAKRVLPKTKLGLSVLQGEDYRLLASTLELDLYDYVELNLKYTFRKNIGIADFLADTRAFMIAFAKLPKLVKVPHEIVDSLHSDVFEEFRRTVRAEDSALLIANTKKAFVPWSRQPGDPRDRSEGVVMGDHLFIDTFTCVTRLSRLNGTSQSEPRMVATGGVTGIGAVIDILAAGADAVQLCSFLDRFKPPALRLLREQLLHLIPPNSNLEQYLSELRRDDGFRCAAIRSAISLYSESEDIIDRLSTPQIQQQILKVVAATLKSELADFGHAGKVAPLIENSENLTFAINRSNVAAAALSLRCIQEYSMNVEQIQGSQDFLRKLRSSTFEFDFAVIPRSVSEDIEKSELCSDEGKNCPIVIGQPIGLSIAHLAGSCSADLVGLDCIYHFGGVASLKAIERMLTDIPRNPLPQFEVINSIQLQPIFKYWNERSAILAKSPLTELYPFLFQDPVKAKWKTLLETSEDLVLVCSKRTFESENGEQTANTVHAALTGFAGDIAADPLRAARELLLYGYMNHLAGLLGAKTIMS